MIRALAKRVQEKRAFRTIVQLKQSMGDMASSSPEILGIMSRFYLRLYASSNLDSSAIDTYLKDTVSAK